MSDTYRMGRRGWEVVMHEDPHGFRYEFIFHHPDTGIVLQGVLGAQHLRRHDRFGRSSQPIEIVKVVTKDQRVMLHMASLEDYHRIDTNRSVAFVESEFHNLPHFAELFMPRPEAQQLIVDPADVQSMLDQILKIQAPIRKEIRARDARRERDSKEVPEIHAQIISLKAA